METVMEIVVSIFAVLVGAACFYAIYRSDKKDLNKGAADANKEQDKV
jgi:hypothetical protein